MVTICRWNGHRCYKSACSSVSVSGLVVLCRRHGNPLGFHQVHVVKPHSVSVFDVRLSRRGRVS